MKRKDFREFIYENYYKRINFTKEYLFIRLNLLKSTAQPKIITQGVETVEKSDIFDNITVSIEHPKTVT